MRDEKRARRWALVGAAFQLASLASFFHGLGTLAGLPALLGALTWVVFGARWVVRNTLIGGLLLGVVLGVPTFLVAYPSYLARMLPARIAEYQRALPIVLAADEAHCRHPPGGSIEETLYSCELQDFLPDQVQRLGQRISVQHLQAGPQAFFQVVSATRLIVIHSAGPTAGPNFCGDLGNGWFTTLCVGRRSRSSN